MADAPGPNLLGGPPSDMPTASPSGPEEAMLDAMRQANGDLDLDRMFPAPQPMTSPTMERRSGRVRRYYFLEERPPAPYVPMPENAVPGSGMGPCQYEGIEIDTDA